MRLATRIPALGATLLATLAISGCGGSSNSAKSSSSSTATVTKTVTGPQSSSATANGGVYTVTNATTAPDTTTTATVGSAATESAATMCVAADLRPGQLASNGTAGTVYYTFTLRNVSDHRCHTYGYPGVSFWTSAGKMLTNISQRTTSDQVGTANPQLIWLAPSAQVSFRVGVVEGYQGGALCQQAATVQIYAPDDTVPLRIAFDGQSCGELTVTPLQPGTSALGAQ